MLHGFDFDHVVSTLLAHGWQQLLSDECAFILKDGDRVVWSELLAYM